MGEWEGSHWVNDWLHLPGLEVRVEFRQDRAIRGHHKAEPWWSNRAGEDHYTATFLHHLDGLVTLT